MISHSHLVCIAVLCSVDLVDVQENIALKQATSQFGTHKVGFSSRAVDGRRDARYAEDSCTHSHLKQFPWWAVDLRWSRQIATVIVTNRVQYADRLTNMTIGVTDENPDVTAPTPHNIDVCVALVDEYIPSGQTVSYPCNRTGRYLAVVLNVDREILTLCEVEVYEVETDITVPPTTAPPTLPPYNYRPSLENHVTLCYLNSLTAQEQQTARDCFRECFLHPCCKAVNITSCEQSYVKTESLHYVKEGITTEPQESCSCAVEFGGTEGTPFSFFNTYEATDSGIRNVSVFHEVAEGIKGIFVEYEGKYVAGTAGEGYRSREQSDCILHPDERITDVIVYKGITEVVDVLFGITFITTRQTCGPFGVVTADSLHASGHQLLFLSGRAKDQITSITLHFDYACAIL